MENQIQNNVLEYSDDLIWDNIVKNSNNLQNPNVFQFSEGVISYKTLKEVSQSVIKKFMDKPKNFGIMKIHIDGVTISDPFRFLSDNPKHINESIETWKKRILPNKTLVIKLDSSITLSDKLNYALEEFLRPLLAAQGIPLGGIGMSLEFGDHKWSPDGLEEDLTQKKKITINIGETNQTIYEWDPEKQQEVGGLIKKKGKVQNFIDYLNNFSKKHEVSKDEIAIMSNQGMYIMEHDGFYYKIRININDLTKTELLQQMLFGISSTAISGKVRGREDANILPVYSTDKHDEFTEEIFKNLQYSGNDLNLSMRFLLKKSFKDICYARRSNCGFLGYIQPIENEKVSEKFRNASKETKIKLKNTNFKIEYYTQERQTYLFMRGHKTVVKQSELVTYIIDTLNEGEIVTFGTLTESKKWKFSAIEKLIQLAYKFKVLDIIND